MKDILYAPFDHRDPPCGTSLFSVGEAEKVRSFHKTLAEYKETPLAELTALAGALGVKGFYVKDESPRFGLNAFKALGGSYVIHKCMKEQRAMGNNGQLTFVTATDGNHGRGIAWAARKMGQKAVVYMPKGSVLERLNNIKAEGAEAFITDMNYDDAVRFANSMAKENGWIMVQDTAWEGYEKYPAWIMQGYTTMALEAVMQLGFTRPTHVFLQAGVGAMAGAVTAFLTEFYGEAYRPKIIIVEPHNANCYYRTAAANDGMPHSVGGDLDSIMAGLCCGEPCSIGYKIIRDHADMSVSIPDCIAAKGMRILAAPGKGDPAVVSGESGAAGVGCAAQILTDPDLVELKEQLGLDADSVVLCFSTEGDTDKENYRAIVWDGRYPSI